MGVFDWRRNNDKAASEVTAPDYDGRFEGVANGQAVGWAWNAADTGVHVAVEIVVDGELVAEGVASNHREALVTLGVGDGSHGFSIALPSGLRDGARQRIGALIGPDRQPLAPAATFWVEATAEGGWEHVPFEPSASSFTPAPPQPPTESLVALVGRDGCLFDAP